MSKFLKISACLVSVLIVPLLFPFSLPAQTDKATKCHVTDVDIWAGKSASEAASKTNSPTTYVEIPKGALVYFYAESQVENDPSQRRLIYTYTYADGKTDTHPTDYNDTNDTANHPYSNTGDYTVSIKCERENFAGSYATNQCKVRITAGNLKVEIVNPEQFITTDTKSATLQNASEGTSVTWSTETLEHPDTGGGTATATPDPDDQRDAYITFNNTGAPSDGRGYPLSYRIKASTGYYTYSADMTQDEISQCRQEYIDMGKDSTPTQGAFSSGGGSEHFSWAELNHSWNYYTNAKYLWIVIRGVLYTGLESTRTNLGDLAMYINSGYRSPMRNADPAVGGAKNSRHIYGDAADVRVDDFNNDGDKDYADWKILADAAEQAGADWIESYAETGTWVHMDWRYH